MKRSNNLRRIFRAAAATLVAGVLSFAGCTTVDDTLGSNLVPDNQQMKAGYMVLGARDLSGELNPKKYVETRLFQTDSIVSSNISYGYMGSMVNDTFGMRTAAFLSQYASYYAVPEDFFGYMPFLDSAQILLSIASYGGDTTVAQTFAVYEVISNDYLTEKPIAEGKTRRDTTFYVNYDIEGAGIIGSDVLFTFALGGDKGPSTTAVTLTPTQAGKDYIGRLMLQSGTYKDDYTIYSLDSLEYWMNEFKGLYIKPVQDATTGGAVYSTTLSSSGLSVYGRNRVESDPTLIQDTIGMVYYFYDQYLDYGNVSVNSVRHDYTNAKFSIADAVETNDNRPPTQTLYVEGMGGVISEITFTQEFFDALEQALETENAASGKGFTTLAFNQAKMSIYFTGAAYDWRDMIDADLADLIAQMNSAQSRLGMYTNYKTLSPISDYAYVYENSYSVSLDYSGYINRSRGCYTMDITGQLQLVWNNYVKEAKAAKAEGRAVNLDNVGKRSIYLGPEAYSLYTGAYTVAQGENPGDGVTKQDAPIKIELAYSMIR